MILLQKKIKDMQLSFLLVCWCWSRMKTHFVIGMHYGKYKHLDKPSQKFCFRDQPEYILNLFTFMFIQFSWCSSHTCYVSPKGRVLFLVIPCISVLHEKLLFKWTTAQGTEKIYGSKEWQLDFLSFFLSILCLCLWGCIM